MKLTPLLLALTVAGCASAQSVSPPSTVGERPTLVVMLTIDQFRGDYIDKFGPQLTGGIARLTRGGAWFSNAHHDHAITETAPGHASLLSGRFPRSTGIATNRAGVDDVSAPLLDSAPGLGASPHRFRGTGLFDWMHAANPRARALSVSMKDRAAILPIGKSKQDVYWYSVNGSFTTSRYYRDTLPTWVRLFNARGLAQGMAGKTWTLLLPESAYPEADSVPIEGFGVDFVFPHVLPADAGRTANLVRGTPWIDDMTLSFALEGVRALNLGTGPQTDLLNVSLSATDLIGHRYGPDSRELHDQFIRVDRAIGVFLDSLYRMRDPARVIVIMSGDHGVGRVPELVTGATPQPVRPDLSPAVLAGRRRLKEAGVDTTALLFEWGTVTVDRAAFGRAGKDAEPILAGVISDLKSIPGVARVDRYRDLMRADTTTDAIARRWLHQFRPEDGVELLVTMTPYSISRAGPATHGSPYDYDSHVPIVFYGAPFKPGRHREFARTVDIGTTAAAVLRVVPTEAVDGRILRPAIR